MALILEREGVALSAAERNKRNDNLTKIENAMNEVSNAVPEAQAAKTLAEEAKAQAVASEKKSANVQEQINQLVIDGDSSVEAAQARVSVDGTNYSTLKERLDAERQDTTVKLAETDEKTDALKGWELQNKTRKPKPLMSIVTDDGYATDYTKLKPIGDAENVPFVMAIIPTRLNTTSYLSTSQLDELYSIGWEVASHSNTHLNLDQLSDQDLDNELRLSKESLNSMGYECTNMVYPFGAYNSKVKEVTRKYYRSARSSDTGVNESPIETYQLDTQLFAENAAIDSRSGLARNTLEFYKLQVDEAVAKNGWLIWLMHSAHTAVTETQLSYLQQTIQYAKSLGVEVVTMQQALDQMANIVDVGDFDKSDLTKEHYVLGANGKESRASINNTIFNSPTDAYSNATLALNFPREKITHTKISSSNAGGLPSSQGGLLITNSIVSQVGYISQRFEAYNSKSVHSRYCKADGTWSAWEYVAPSYIDVLATDAVGGATQPAAFTPGRITYCKVTNASGLPFAQGGVLITDAMVGQNGYIKQRLETYNTKAVYARYAQADGTWSAWEQTSLNFMVSAPSNAFTAASLYTDFEANKITYSKVTNANAAGMPNAVGGMLITDRMDSSLGYIGQTFNEYNTGESYRRIVNASGVWTAWKKLTP